MSKQYRWIFTVAVAGLALVATVNLSLAASEGLATAEKGEQASTLAVTAELDGAKVYAWNCGSCHSERRPRERNDAEWEVIAMHMRVRANLTAAQTRAVLDYLQENN